MSFRIRPCVFLWIALTAAVVRAQTASTSKPDPAGMPQWEILRHIDDFGGLDAYAEANAALPAASANRLSSTLGS